jgi:hypothetical protein
VSRPPADPVTAACGRIALLVASSQPLYPFYVRWLVGGDWRVAFWTFLSTPFFAAVPLLARRRPAAARALLPATGIANGIVSAKAFGTASAVELFLIPCALIAALACSGWVRIALLAATAGAALLHCCYGAPLGRFDAEQSFRALNLYSVAVLTAVILWQLIRARRAMSSR